MYLLCHVGREVQQVRAREGINSQKHSTGQFLRAFRIWKTEGVLEEGMVQRAKWLVITKSNNVIWILTRALKVHSVRVPIGEMGFSKHHLSP